MTDLEEIPDDPTPLAYERLPNLQPPAETPPEAEGTSMKKVLHRNDVDTPTRLGGLSD